MKPYLPYIYTCIICYLIGSIHPAYIIGKLSRNIDIRDCGSGNSGASNATVIMGLKYGAITAVIDILKGALALLLSALLFSALPIMMYHASMSVIFGHIFPFYLGFKGGKGLATLLGVCFMISKLLFAIAVVILLAVSLISDYIALGTVCASVAFLIFTVVRFGFISVEAALAALICAVMLVKHKDNYKRIYEKTETKVSSLYKKERA